MKKFLLFFILLFTFFETKIIAQSAPEWSWAKNIYTTPIPDPFGDIQYFSKGIVTDLYGNVFVTGTFPDSAYFNGTLVHSYGTQDIFLVKYSPSGNLLWIKQAGGIKKDQAHAICFDLQGNLCVAGFCGDTASFGSHIFYCTSHGNMFIAKYDPVTGDNISVVSVGENLNGTNPSISLMKIDSLGNYYLSGVAWQQNFGGQIASGNFVSVMDSNLTLKWVSSFFYYSNNSQPDIFSIAYDKYLNVYETGIIRDTVLIQGNYFSPNASDGFIIKHDNNSVGNILSTNQLQGENTQAIMSIINDGNSSNYFFAFTEDTCFFDSSNVLNFSNFYNGFIQKTDLNGNAYWLKKIILPNGGYITSGSLLFENENIICAFGTFHNKLIIANDTVQSLSTTFNSNASLLFKLNQTGDLLWGTQFAGYTSQQMNLCADSFGNYFVTGNTNNAIFISDTIKGNFIARLGNFVTGEKGFTKEYLEVTIFPNPTTSQINITSKNNIDKVVITNLVGQIIYEYRNSTSQRNGTSIDGKNLSLQIESNGMYFITVTAVGETATQKIIVQE